MSLIREIIDFANTHLKSTSTTNIREIDKFFIFDALEIRSIYKSKHSKIKELEKDFIERKDLSSLLALKLFKYHTSTDIIKKSNNNVYYHIKSIYKERKRTTYYIEDNSFTHLLTVTYKAKENSNFFEIYEYNKKLIQKFRKGFNRLRAYFKKNGLEKIKYIAVREATEKLTLHFHVLIRFPKKFREDFRKMIKLLANWFETAENGIDIKYLKISERKSAIKYIAKYMNKGKESTIGMIGDSKIIVYNKTALMLSMIQRIYSYSYSNKVKIKRHRTSKAYKTDKTIEEKAERETSEIKKLDRNMFSDLLKKFTFLEYLRFYARENLKTHEKEIEFRETELPQYQFFEDQVIDF